MEDSTYINELEYIKKLYDEIIAAFPEYRVYTEKKYDSLRPDISIENENFNIIIEVKNARNYSSLPFSTLMQLEDYKNIPNSNVILISLSEVNKLMEDKLKEMDIKTFIKPNFKSIIKYLKEETSHNSR